MNLTYCIRNVVGSYLGVVILFAIIKFTIWEYTPEQYDLAGTIFGTLIFFIGFVGIGYLNTKHAPDNKLTQSSIVHLVLVTLMLITDLLFGDSKIYIDILRNASYLVAFQFGAYIYVRRQFRNLHV